MLPGDEQLVPYGEDSTLSVVRSVARAPSAISAITLVWERAEAGRRRLIGAKLTHQERKTTTYTLKNNASAATDGTAKTVADPDFLPRPPAHASSIPTCRRHHSS